MRFESPSCLSMRESKVEAKVEVLSKSCPNSDAWILIGRLALSEAMGRLPAHAILEGGPGIDPVTGTHDPEDHEEDHQEDVWYG
jgi:hypothetical protein